MTSLPLPCCLAIGIRQYPLSDDYRFVECREAVEMLRLLEEAWSTAWGIRMTFPACQMSFSAL